MNKRKDNSQSEDTETKNALRVLCNLVALINVTIVVWADVEPMDSWPHTFTVRHCRARETHSRLFNEFLNVNQKLKYC